MTAPRFAILFWYYKQPEVCRDRARLLRRLNPGTLILGLYGGEPGAFPDFGKSLKGLLSDNWLYPGEQNGDWKWRHGDRMICEWFEHRGRSFDWDTLVIMQWDMLALAPVCELFGKLRPDELYLPGLRPLEEMESRWWWTRPGTEVHDEYLTFRQWIATRTGYTGTFQACQFVTAALPRAFLERYTIIDKPELGFLEYKIPAYAAAWGFAARDLPHLPTAWVGDPPAARRITLTAAKTDISTETLALELLKPGGARLFHPFCCRFPSHRSGMLAWLVVECFANLGRRIAAKIDHRMRTFPKP